MLNTIGDLLQRHKSGQNIAAIFWDFDGVIKESINVKTQAFIRLFSVYGKTVAERVRKHHEANGGMSRFEKMPIYLGWAGEEPSVKRQKELCDQFAELVITGVIDAPWVSGVETILRKNPHRQLFFLVSATPQDELETILLSLDLGSCFAEVFGSPISKKSAIQKVLEVHNLRADECLMIGDALADHEAADANQVPFFLRRHETNYAVFATYVGPSFKDFNTL